MRRADRLFEILQLLRGGRLRTALALAQALEVSTRTIWRDIADLQAQGIPIEGERGLGYLLRENFFLPPLALTLEEMEALSFGVRLIETYGDESMAVAARELAIKIAAVSPDDRRRTRLIMSVFAAPTAQMAKGVLATMRRAITDRRMVAICYRDLEGRQSSRTIHPLHLEFWGQAWTLTAWCKKRGDFRVFRCDRITAYEVLTERFQDVKGKDYASFLALVDKRTPHDAKPR